VPKKFVNGKKMKDYPNFFPADFPGGLEVATSWPPGKSLPDSREVFLLLATVHITHPSSPSSDPHHGSPF